MGGAIGAVTRVFDALCASPLATRMGDTHHVATCTRTAVDRYRPDDLARAPGEQTRTLKIEHAARARTARRCAPAAPDRLAPKRCAIRTAARQRRRRDAEIVCGGEVSFGPPSRFTSFDHLVGGRKQRRWNGAERSGSRDVDDEIELGRLHHWKVGRFGALENAGGIEPRHPKRLRQAGAVAHQASSLGVLSGRKDSRETLASRQRGELYSSAEEIPIGANNRRSVPQHER